MANQPVVLLTNPIHAEAQALLESHASLITAPDTHPDTLRKLAENADGIVVRAQLPDDIVDHAPRLKGIVRHGVGLDFIPVDAATRRGIPVANLPGVNAQAVTEFCFTTMLQLRRPLALVNDTFKQEGWDTARAIATETTEIAGTALGIVGVGTIGRRIAETARRGFGMTVMGASRHKGRMPEGIDEVDLDELFSRSDVIILSCALTDETHGLVNAYRLALMKPDAVLINVSRGPIIETDALIAALRAEAIGAAAIDVFDIQPLPNDSELLNCPRLQITPHVAGITSTSMHGMSMGAAREMIRILQGKDPQHLVNPSYLI
ncbi:NAD(P)-dependent oxidoreductase [Aidingimonas lacisalsi]|uniref:NAD(P)-dependent oxidoreductase n=1 Tax=Aidingimonas lacisalsi TaxID=2604086 RepID=UPI0011D281AA|nr:NAD(P)-dependent oxidoreductase [Aidingimonas lacisalsi]